MPQLVRIPGVALVNGAIERHFVRKFMLHLNEECLREQLIHSLCVTFVYNNCSIYGEVFQNFCFLLGR